MQSVSLHTVWQEWENMWGIVNVLPSRAVVSEFTAFQSSVFQQPCYTLRTSTLRPSCNREGAHPCRKLISTEMLGVSSAIMSL